MVYLRDFWLGGGEGVWWEMKECEMEVRKNIA